MKKFLPGSLWLDENYNMLVFITRTSNTRSWAVAYANGDKDGLAPGCGFFKHGADVADRSRRLLDSGFTHDSMFAKRLGRVDIGEG